LDFTIGNFKIVNITIAPTICKNFQKLMGGSHIY
jgi:hypothetical protein